MGAMTEIKVPDIDDFKDVPIIEIMVKPGDAIKPEDPHARDRRRNHRT